MSKKSRVKRLYQPILVYVAAVFFCSLSGNAVREHRLRVSDMSSRLVVHHFADSSSIYSISFDGTGTVQSHEMRYILVVCAMPPGGLTLDRADPNRPFAAAESNQAVSRGTPLLITVRPPVQVSLACDGENSNICFWAHGLEEASVQHM